MLKAGTCLLLPEEAEEHTEVLLALRLNALQDSFAGGGQQDPLCPVVAFFIGDGRPAWSVLIQEPL